MATGRKVKERHTGIAAAGCQHLSIGWPGLFVLTPANQQQFPAMKAMLAVDPERRVAPPRRGITVEQIASGAVNDRCEVATKRYGGLKAAWLGEQELRGTKRAG